MSALGDFIEDKKATSPEMSVMDDNMGELTRSALLSLTPREQEILRMRYGLNEARKEHTLKECGDEIPGYSRAHSSNRGKGPTEASNAFTFPQAARICKFVSNPATCCSSSSFHHYVFAHAGSADQGIIHSVEALIFL